jgi:hypothetical protein
MAENQEGINEYLEKLALLAEGLDQMHIGSKAIIFDMPKEEFIKTRDLVKNISEDKDKFKIDISGVEFIYLLNELS